MAVARHKKRDAVKELADRHNISERDLCLLSYELPLANQ
jgi:hypothetical protein